ncbi:MAG: energy transducer TonB [Terracidiphilus sp.]|jgi:TonB family protein
MAVRPNSEEATFGLLPDPERSPGSFITSIVINGLALALLLLLGATAKKEIDQHRYEETLLLLPTKPPPPPAKVKLPPPPEVDLPKPPDVKLEAPKIDIPKPKPEPKPIVLETKLALPVIQPIKPNVIEAPQPKSALNIVAKPNVVTAQPTKKAIFAAAMPAQNNSQKPSMKPVHFGQTFGVTPNPNAKGPATIAAIGNPYGGMQGPAVAPHGVVGSTGFGNGTKFGSNSGVVGKVASAGVRGTTNVTQPVMNPGKVASVGITAAPTAVPPAPQMRTGPPPTDVEVISKPQPQYTSEAKQLKVQGDVVLRVNFAANGQVVVQGIVHGLGHGLDEEARRVAQQIRFRPATRNGQAVDKTTIITITFQLA